MNERAIDFVIAKDRDGKEHQYYLTASALRRIVRRLRQLSKEDQDETVMQVESVYIYAWESRVDRTEEDEEAYFDKFSIQTLRGIVVDLQKQHQPEPDPMEPEPEKAPAIETKKKAG